MNVIYTAIAHATGDGRNGHVHSEDGELDLDVRVPKEMGGPGGGSNPEELFAAGYAACFHSALKLVAGRMSLDASQTQVSASVGIGPNVSGGFELVVQLDVHAPHVAAESAQALVEATHQVCPYSNATRGNVDVTLSIV